MKEPPVMITIKELTRRADHHPGTVRKWLREKGIEPHGRSILMDDLRRCWPAMHSAILFAMGVMPPCPQCGTNMKCECPICDVTFGF